MQVPHARISVIMRPKRHIISGIVSYNIPSTIQANAPTMDMPAAATYICKLLSADNHNKWSKGHKGEYSPPRRTKINALILSFLVMIFCASSDKKSSARRSTKAA